MLFQLLDASYSSNRGGNSTDAVTRGEFAPARGLPGAAENHR